MRAMLINEKFEKESDPIEDMKIGIKNYKDYLKKELARKNLNVKEIMQWWMEQMMAENSKEDLVNLLLEVIEDNSIEYQISFANNIIEHYEYYKDKKI